jgi:hypothetical protein
VSDGKGGYGCRHRRLLALRLGSKACAAASSPLAPASKPSTHTHTAGNSKFVEAHRHLVNARRITFNNDIIPYLPCAGGAGARGMPACADTAVRTDQGARLRAHTAWVDYQPLFGSVTFGAESMPPQSEAWVSKTRNFKVASASVSHVCSYTCKASSYSAGDVDTWCLLAPNDDPAVMAAHTYCPGYPKLEPTAALPRERAAPAQQP